jgi:hypothetical protein
MINEKNLREALTFLATQALTQYETCSLLSEQVQALQETVRGLNPTFDDVLAQKQLHRTKTSASAVIVPAVKAELSEIIRQLKAGLVC